MGRLRELVWVGAWLGLAGVPGLATAQQRAEGARFTFPVRESLAHGSYSAPPVPVELLHPTARPVVRRVLDDCTLTTRGPAESFACQPATYFWLLDHPDQAVHLWKQLGAKVTEIEDRGNGQFGYRDGAGTDVTWSTVLMMPGMRVWYAEGHVKPGVLLPRTKVEAVLILSYRQGADDENRPTIRHQMHLLVKTDSRAVALAARILGSSAPRLAEQYMGQLQMFYGALAWYLDHDAERARKLFRAIGLAVPAAGQRTASTAP